MGYLILNLDVLVHSIIISLGIPCAADTELVRIAVPSETLYPETAPVEQKTVSVHADCRADFAVHNEKRGEEASINEGDTSFLDFLKGKQSWNRRFCRGKTKDQVKERDDEQSNLLG